MTAETSITKRAKDLLDALDHMSAAANLLNPYSYDDPRVGSVVRELDGCDMGWAPPDPAEDDYLFDRLLYLFVEAGGKPGELTRYEHSAGMEPESTPHDG